MAIRRDQPYPGMNFQVDLGTADASSAAAGVMSVHLPEARIDVLQYRDGTDKDTGPRHLQALSRYTPLIVRRGYAGSLDWYDWWNQVRNGDLNARRTVTVALLTEDRSAVVTLWRFHNARPASWHVAALDALNGGTLMETLELVIDRMDVE
jgi:phage tail-like protein